MKIGIITLSFNNNYGGYLQAYALQTILESLGNEVIVINRTFPSRSFCNSFIHAVKRSIRTVITGHRYPILSSDLEYKGRKMQSFVYNRLHLSRKITSSSSLVSYCKNECFDAVVVGSDQVWRPGYVMNIDDYFLDYLPERTIRFSYAASFGTDNPLYSEEEKFKCCRALEKFNKISLREESGINVMKNNGWKTDNVQIVLDPTMLLSSKNYLSLIVNYVSAVNTKNKILKYILDNDSQIEVISNNIQKILKMEYVDIIDPKKWKEPYYILPSIEEWLCAFRDAGFVITDSFHGTVFCILMHVPFAVYVNKSRGCTRFNTLLSYVGLNYRIIESSDDLGKILSTPIDWLSVDRYIDNYRNSSLCFIKESLKMKDL